MTDTKKAYVSEEKKAFVKELTENIDNKNTIMLVSIKGLPATQFQKIKKSLSGEVEIKVPKKRMLKMAIDNSKKEGIKKLDEYLKEDIAILISDIDAFELAEKLEKNKSPVKAKEGQEAPEDISVEAGPTDLPAGPAVSELGSLGLTVKVSNGKIEIIQGKVIVEKGRIISDMAAGVMGKLDMLPFSVGYIPLIAYDSKTGKVYETLVMDKKELIENLKSMFAKSKSLSVNVGYVCKETIIQMMAKANSYEKTLGNLVKENINEEENKSEEKVEEVVEEEEKKEEVTEEKKEESEKKENVDEVKEEKKNE